MAKQYNNKQSNENREKIVAPNIILDYTKQEQLFGEVAEKWALKLEQDGTRTRNKINQIRSFYDKVLELHEKSQNKDDLVYKKEIFPFVVMLNSKVAYAKTRDLVSQSFVDMINQCVKGSTDVYSMNNFKLFFEAVIGFYPKK